jgi:rod shape-determining protein MreC
MTLRRRVLDYSLAGILLLLPAVLLHASLKDREDLNGFDEAVLRVSSPLQSAVSWVIGGVGGVWHRYVALVDIEDENAELRRENERLRRDLAEARRQVADTEVLEELVALRRRTTSDSIGARIVSSSINPFFRVMRIRLDRGEGEVERGMAVISAQGVVGRIDRVYGTYADVLLAVDPESGIDVKIPRTGGRGTLRGLGRQDSYAATVERLERGPAELEVQVGDLVVTSGLGEDFPAGIPVGHITAIQTKEYALFQEVEVDPVVDFSDLDAVLVLTAHAPPADPDAGEDRTSRRAHGMRPY